MAHTLKATGLYGKYKCCVQITVKNEIRLSLIQFNESQVLHILSAEGTKMNNKLQLNSSIQSKFYLERWECM